MLASEKRRQEQELLKAGRIQNIEECAFGLFADHGIENISMNEIALHAEIGVASLYRYFSTKEDLAIATGVYAWKKEIEIFKMIFSADDYGTKNGYQQLSDLFSRLPETLVSQGSFFRFVYYFDSYIVNTRIQKERLQEYEETISLVNNIIFSALQKGLDDGSIKLPGESTLSYDELLFTMSHSIFSLMQKLSVSGDMLYMDKKVTACRQIELLLSIFLNSLK